MLIRITRPLAALVAAGAFAIAGLAGTRTTGAAASVPAPTRARSPVIAYVLSDPTCSGNTVTPINAATSKALKPIRVGHGAQAIAITPNGRTVYVASGKWGFPGTVCGEGTPRPTNTVSAISTATNKVVKTIRVGRYPGAIAITPNGKTAYVVSNRGVVPIHIATNTPGNAISSAATHGARGPIALTPDGKTLYATGNSPGSLIAIRTATNKIVKTIKLRNSISGIAITPDSKTAYILTRNFDSGWGALTAIRTATNHVVRTIQARTWAPIAIAITPDGKTVYVIGGTSVFPVRVATNTRRTPIRTGTFLSSAIAFTPDSKTAYVAGWNNARKAGIVIPIHTATNTTGKPIVAQTSPGFAISAIGITPNGKTAYLLNEIDVPTPGHPGTVIPLRITTRTIGTPITVAEGPAAIVFTP